MFDNFFLTYTDNFIICTVPISAKNNPRPPFALNFCYFAWTIIPFCTERDALSNKYQMRYNEPNIFDLC